MRSTNLFPCLLYIVIAPRSKPIKLKLELVRKKTLHLSADYSVCKLALTGKKKKCQNASFWCLVTVFFRAYPSFASLNLSCSKIKVKLSHLSLPLIEWYISSSSRSLCVRTLSDSHWEHETKIVQILFIAFLKSNFCKHCLICLDYLLSVMDYSGRLRRKGNLFSGA